MSPEMKLHNQGSTCLLSVCGGWRGPWLQVETEPSTSRGVEATHPSSRGTSDTAGLPS